MDPSPRPGWQRVLREPLLHFAVVGVALFAAVGSRPSDAPARDRRIVVSRAVVAELAAGFALERGRPPTAADLDALVEARVREEVWLREAVAEGLDREDAVVRRRLALQMESRTDATADAATPSDAELRAWWESRPGAWGDGTPPPPFDAVRGAVEASWREARRAAARDEAYRKARARYEVEVEGPAPAAAGS